jgi:hypothetical protein
LFGHIDQTATTFADPLEQLVAPECLARGFVRRIGEIEFDSWARRFGRYGQQCLGLLVRSEQGFKAHAQRRIASAHRV